MGEQPDIKNFVFCQECNVFYHKERQEAAEKRSEELRQEDLPALALSIEACPLCALKKELNLIAIHLPDEPIGGLRARRRIRVPLKLPSRKRFISFG